MSKSTTRFFRLFIVVIAGLFGFSAIARADSISPWPYPKIRAVSSNEKYRFKVIYKRSGAQGVFAVRKKSGRYKKHSKFPLLNWVAPGGRALVSDDGRYIVTVSNLVSRRGSSVIVIYRTDGTVINSLALRDFLTDEDIDELPHSVSFIHWSGPHFFEESKGLLILQIAACQQPVSSCDISFEVPISLEAGLPTMPKSSHFPQPRIFLSTASSPETDEAGGRDIEPFCNSGQVYPEDPEASFVSTADIMARIVDSPLPSYSRIARKAKIQGSVVLEVAVLASGEVGCVKLLRGLPMGLGDDLRSAVLGWRFDPSRSNGRTASFVGRFTVECRWVEQEHPAYSNVPRSTGDAEAGASSE